MYPTDEGESMELLVATDLSDDACMWAMYIAVADNETTGTYTGLTTDYELQFSFKYSYS